MDWEERNIKTSVVAGYQLTVKQKYSKSGWDGKHAKENICSFFVSNTFLYRIWIKIWAGKKDWK